MNASANQTPSIERDRLTATYERGEPWLRWGPYLSERQWGTVREDYSSDGNAWAYFSHDQARSRAYRWGEDGLAGVSDDHQRLCFALALWNGADPIIKERAFGLTNSEGNHGEDVKEYWFYVDSTPTHSWMRWRYKYPQRAYPYDDLVETNKSRTREDPEYELVDTGIFDDGRYFDVEVDYAKAGPDDLLIRITAANRGPDPATLDLLPHLWFRNTWTGIPNAVKPVLRAVPSSDSKRRVVRADHPDLGSMWLIVDGDADLLFTENETNTERIFNEPNAQPYVKDGINDAVVAGRTEAVNPAQTGTKVAARTHVTVAPGETAVLRLRLTGADPDAPGGRSGDPFGASFDAIGAARSAEADAFYTEITPTTVDPERALVMRQALAGMLWSKQYYEYDVRRWLSEHGLRPDDDADRAPRNGEWLHLFNADIISMPDKWEYPWFAAWDLAFHTVALGIVDREFARNQLRLLLREPYLHPNGQLPAYEWNFSDVNPPVHAWASFFAFGGRTGTPTANDYEFLAEVFQKLALNFSWWVNRKDAKGRNVFQGGFLGLDNIGLFDRSKPLPDGGTLEQADGTAWMAFFAQTMTDLALELAARDPAYAEMAVKFVQHFYAIAGAMDRVGEVDDELWDEEDGFFYDVLSFPDGHSTRLKVRSLVGLLPLCAVTVLPGEFVQKYPDHAARIRKMLERDPTLVENLPSPAIPGVNGRRLLAVMGEDKLRRVLARVLDEQEFLSPYGIRSISKEYETPFEFDLGGERSTITYNPAESDSSMFGGNSNWRGPIWFPINLLIVRALLHYYAYFGNDFTIECPTGSGVQMNLFEVAKNLGDRLVSIFLPDADGRRPVFGGTKIYHDDPNWHDLLQFHEYFHGDNGAGIGAAHQTGWTGLVAVLITLFGRVDAELLLAGGLRGAIGVTATATSGAATTESGTEAAGVPVMAR